MIDVKTIIAGPVETNCYIVKSGGQSIVIDPGGSGAVILEELEGPLAVVCTHGHSDHFAGCVPLQKAGIPLWIGEKDAPMLKDPSKNLSYFTGTVFALDKPADRFLREGDVVQVGEISFTVLELPGHTIGSIGLYGGGMLFGGDVLFHDSIGRTDLPGGDFQQLKTTIQQKLFSLPGETRVLPGHGDETTIAYEKAHNPYVRMEK